jgi:hypothetical protein
VHLLHVSNQLDGIVTAAPPYAVSPDLKVYPINILNESTYTCLEKYSNICCRRTPLKQNQLIQGHCSDEHFTGMSFSWIVRARINLMWSQAIVKARRFDLPPGIETNATDFGKVIAVVQEAFTQLRAKFKKSVCHVTISTISLHVL